MTRNNVWLLTKLIFKFLGYSYIVYLIIVASWANLTGKNSFSIRSPLPPFSIIDCRSGNSYIGSMH